MVRSGIFSPKKLVEKFTPLRRDPGVAGRWFPGLSRPLKANLALTAEQASLGRIGSLEVRLARTGKEIKAAQRLRYHVFYEEMSAIADAQTQATKRDVDPFDAICDHMLVVDHACLKRNKLGRLQPQIVGTYRLLRQSVADQHGGFYTSSEYDIQPLLDANPTLNFLELGRSCVLKPYRNQRTVELLWHGFWAYVWQQSICCTFILLSGYCWQMGRHPLRRGLMSFGGGLAVSLVTALAMPEDPVRFGVLTFLGTAMLLTVPLRRWLDRVPPRLGLAGAFGLFLLVRNINDGFLGFAGVPILMLPRSWYANLFTAGLGFPGPGFVSSDYFSLLPWLLLFWTGYFLYRLRPAEPLLPDIRLPGFSAMGRHSLLIYLLHQPVLYALLVLLPTFL